MLSIRQNPHDRPRIAIATHNRRIGISQRVEITGDGYFLSLRLRTTLDIRRHALNYHPHQAFQLLLSQLRAIGIKIVIRVAADARQQLRNAKVISSLLIAASIFALVASRPYHRD
jgi:hypothetical protein